MPEDTQADAPSGADDPGGRLVDDELHAAEETRVAARWIASALGALPAVGALTALIRAPGDAGFDPALLSVGVVAIGVGGFLALTAFARVLTPIGISDEQLADFPMSRLDPSWPEEKKLREELTSTRTSLAELESDYRTATIDAKEAEALAAGLEALAMPIETAAKDSSDPGLRARAEKARLEADTAGASAVGKAASAAAKDLAAEDYRVQLRRLGGLRANAIRLKAADEVRSRFASALAILPIVAMLLAFGVIALALAPKPSEEPSGEPAPTLVTLELNDAGRAALGCAAPSLQALRVGGQDDAPLVITLPIDGCPAKLVTFRTDQGAGMGAVVEAEPIEPPAASPE